MLYYYKTSLMKQRKNLKKKSAVFSVKTTSLTASKPTRPKALSIKEYQKQQRLLFALQQVSKVLTAEVNLQDILKDMATILAKSLGAKRVNFWNLTPDKKAVYIVAHHGMKPEYMEHSRQYPIRLGTAWIGRAVKTGRAWGTSDILDDPHLLKELGPKWKKAIEKQDYRGLLCVPLVSGKNVVGGLCAYFAKPHEFTDFEMRLMTVASNQAATALTNAKIFEELVSERNKSVSIINSLSDGLIVYDLENRITSFNPRSEELLWVYKDDVIGKKVSELSLKNPLFKNITTISSLHIGDFETKELLTQKPQRLFLKITQVPVRDSQAKKLGSLRVLHDLTAEREAEELKSRFVSVASHQLRTPLSRIKWVLDMFLKKEVGELNAQQYEFLERLYGENEQMIGLISDLLDVSRIEEGRFGYEFKPLDLVKTAEEQLSGFSQAIKKRNLRALFDKPSSPLPQISADKEKLVMAIHNVIDNSIKYTLPRGKINISLSKGEASLILKVKDNGIGIPKDQQKFIFTRFFRARNAIRLQTAGSGLGLWIANEIVKRHNGKIHFESEENKGSEFLLQFPLDPQLQPKG